MKTLKARARCIGIERKERNILNMLKKADEIACESSIFDNLRQET